MTAQASTSLTGGPRAAAPTWSDDPISALSAARRIAPPRARPARRPAAASAVADHTVPAVQASARAMTVRPDRLPVHPVGVRRGRAARRAAGPPAQCRAGAAGRRRGRGVRGPTWATGTCPSSRKPTTRASPIERTRRARGRPATTAATTTASAPAASAASTAGPSSPRALVPRGCRTYPHRTRPRRRPVNVPSARRRRGMLTVSSSATTADRDQAEDQRRGVEEGDRDRAEGQHRGPEVHDEDRAGVAVAALQQPVVQVLLVRGERRPAGCRPADDGEQQVEERHHHHGERQQQRHQGRGDVGADVVGVRPSR